MKSEVEKNEQKCRRENEKKNSRRLIFIICEMSNRDIYFVSERHFSLERIKLVRVLMRRRKQNKNRHSNERPI